MDKMNEEADIVARAVEDVVQRIGVMGGFAGTSDCSSAAGAVAGCGLVPESSTAATAQRDITDHFCELHAALDERHQELIHAANDLRAHKLAALGEQHAALGVVRSQMHMVRFQAEATLNVSDTRH